MKWLTPSLRVQSIGTGITRLALFTELRGSLGRRDGRWIGAKPPEVQSSLSTQIHSKLVCGGRLSAHRAEDSRLCVVPRLDFCTALPAALWPEPAAWCSNSLQSSALTVQDSAELFSDTQHLPDNQTLHLCEKLSLYTWLITKTHP